MDILQALVYLIAFNTTAAYTMSTFFALGFLCILLDFHTAFLHGDNIFQPKRDAEDDPRPQGTVTVPMAKRSLATELLHFSYFFMLQFAVCQAAEVLSHGLINTFATEETMFLCMRDYIRGYNCPLSVQWKMALNYAFALFLFSFIRLCELHEDSDGREGLVIRGLRILLGAPINVVRVYCALKNRTIIHRLVLYTSQGVMCCVIVRLDKMLIKMLAQETMLDSTLA